MIANLRESGSTETRVAFRYALIQQVACALLSALTLDGGQAAKVCAATILGYWAAVAWFLHCGPLLNSRTDLTFVRWGFLLLFLAAQALTGPLKRWIGS